MNYKWWVSPYINHFISADAVVPSYANPQSLNRYSYVLNNPVKLTDPTGHKCVGEEDECKNDNGKPINGAGGLPKPKSNSDNPLILPCGGKLSCNDQSLYDYFMSILPFTKSDICNVVHIDAQICKFEYQTSNPLLIGYDPSRIDPIEMIVDLAGVTTDAGTIIFYPAGPELQGAGLVIDLTAANYSLYKATNGEVGLGDLTLDVFIQVVEEHPVVAARMGRAVPVVGIVGNLFSIGENLSSGLYMPLQTTIPPNTLPVP